MAPRKPRSSSAIVPAVVNEPVLSMAIDPVTSVMAFSLGAGLVRMLGQGVAWAFPKKVLAAADAEAYRVGVVGQAHAIVEKQRTGAVLSQDDRRFLEQRIRQREAQRLSNVLEVVEQMEAVKEEVAVELPPHTPEEKARGTSSTFKHHAWAGAEEISEKHVREMFARLLAAEDARPGRFSARTLDLLRLIDAETAKAFDTARSFILNDSALPLDGPRKYIDDHGLPYDRRMLLEDAGLLVGPVLMTIAADTFDEPQMRVGKRRVMRWGWGNLGHPVRVEVQRLTRAGVELHSVLPLVGDDVGYAHEVGEWLKRSGYIDLEHRRDRAKNWTRVGA